MDQKYQYDYEWDSSYCYPHSFILKNKLNIQDGKTLDEAERKLTALRILSLQSTPIKGNFDLRHLQQIHHFLFQDIYPWAGKLRTVNIAKGNLFCNCLYIESESRRVFETLRCEHHFLIETEPELVPEKLAYYLGEINVIHPFREGNGRAQRVFIQYLAQAAGYHVDFSNVTRTEMIEASARAFGCDYKSMNDLFQRITTPILPSEQEDFIHSIAVKDSPILKTFEEVQSRQTNREEEETQHFTL